MASDEQLASCCECPREVYLEDDSEFRESFAPATIARWCERKPYGDNQAIMSEGALAVGSPAPDVEVHLVDVGAPPGAPRTTVRLLAADVVPGGVHSYNAAEWTTRRSLVTNTTDVVASKRYLVLDFGSFS